MCLRNVLHVAKKAKFSRCVCVCVGVSRVEAQKMFYDKLFATNFVYLMVCLPPLAMFNVCFCSKFNWK